MQNLGQKNASEPLLGSLRKLPGYCKELQTHTQREEHSHFLVQNYCQMSEVSMAVIKPEMMKTYIWLQTTDGSIQEVEQEVAMFCPIISQEINKGMGSSKNYPISLPQRVSPAMLSLILDYCRFHQVPGRSNKEHKSFDEKFIRTDTKRLCELASAADSLKLKPLVDLTSRALARVIEGKTPEEIREIFHLPDDLTEEEKLEPMKNTTNDPQIRLLNRLNAKKRKQLKEREKLKNVDVEESVDDHSVDDRSEDPRASYKKVGALLRSEQAHLLMRWVPRCTGFDDLTPHLPDNSLRISDHSHRYKASLGCVWSRWKSVNEGVKTSKHKKKNRKRKDQQQRPACSNEAHKEESNGVNSVCHNEMDGKFIPTDLSRLQDVGDTTFIEFDDGDIDDEIDPELKEKIDREVEDFARRLNSDWPERMQEILSLGQERGPVSTSINGNGSLGRYAKNEFFFFPVEIFGRLSSSLTLFFNFSSFLTLFFHLMWFRYFYTTRIEPEALILAISKISSATTLLIKRRRKCGPKGKPWASGAPIRGRVVYNEKYKLRKSFVLEGKEMVQREGEEEIKVNKTRYGWVGRGVEPIGGDFHNLGKTFVFFFFEKDRFDKVPDDDGVPSIPSPFQRVELEFCFTCYIVHS
uniref:SKP1 family n=1 Tax=Paeonia suffruticosa TaxID=45171 RepID=A0AB38Z7S2_PAESU